MAAFTSYPTTNEGCYQSLYYEYSHTIVGNSNPMSIEVDVLINGVSFRTLFLSAYDSVTQVSSDYVYVFKIDISKVVQSYFDNSQFFYDSDKTYPYSDEALTANVVLDVYRYEPNVNGVLTRNATATRSNSRFFFNSLKSDFSDYVATTGRKFISKKTDLKLSTQVTNLISVFGGGNVTTCKIDADATTTNVTLTTDQITIINLNDYFDINDNTLTLTLGTLDGEDFTTTGEQLIFNIVDTICEPCGLHFQNELGTSEVFIFKDYEYSIERERDTQEYITNNNLVRMYDGDLNKNIELERNGFFDNELNYFQDTVTSSIFYVEQTTGTLNEVFSTFNDTPLRTVDNEIDIRLSFTYSNEQSIYNN